MFSQDKFRKVIMNNQHLNSFISEGVKEFMKSFLETILEEEIRIFIGRDKYERKNVSVQKYRNGTRERYYFTLQAGMLRIKVPRCRGFYFSSILLNKRSITQKELEDTIVQIWAEGGSYRDLQNLVKKIYGEYFSLKKFHSMIKSLDVYVEQFHRKQITFEYESILIDGLEFSVKGLPKKYYKEYYRARRKNAVMLAVLGVRQTGKKIIKEILDYMIVTSEDEIGYTKLLRSLKNRGLSSVKFKVIVHDGEGSISKAIRNVYGKEKISEQRCMVHKKRNVINAIIDKNNKDDLSKDVWKTYTSKTKEEFLYNQSKVYTKWKFKEPEAMKIFNRRDNKILTKFEFEQDIHKIIHSNNYIERYFKEIRRRTKAIGVFENIASADRLLFLVIEYLNQRRGSIPTNSKLKFTH